MSTLGSSTTGTSLARATAAAQEREEIRAARGQGRVARVTDEGESPDTATGGYSSGGSLIPSSAIGGRGGAAATLLPGVAAPGGSTGRSRIVRRTGGYQF